MAVIRISNIIGATAATLTVDGVIEATISTSKTMRPSRADAELGHATIDSTFLEATGTLTVDNHTAYLLCDGVVKVLVLSFKDATGATKTTTIGVLGDLTGVLFTGFNLQAAQNDAEGPAFRWVLDFVCVFKGVHTALTDLIVTA